MFAFPSVAAGASRGSSPSPAKRAALAAARAALLRRSDLHGWGATPPAKKVPPLTCGTFSPDLSGIRVLGSAASSTFAQGSSGPFVGETSYVFASATQERSFWHRVVVRRLLDCVADSLTAGSSSSVTFTAQRKQLLPLPRIGARDAGYQVRGTANSADGSQTVYLDMLVVGRGSAVGAVSFTSFFDPVSRSLELRLARLVAKRMAGS